MSGRGGEGGNRWSSAVDNGRRQPRINQWAYLSCSSTTLDASSRLATAVLSRASSCSLLSSSSCTLRFSDCTSFWAYTSSITTSHQSHIQLVPGAAVTKPPLIVKSADWLRVARPILLICISLAEVVITLPPPVIFSQVISQSFSFFFKSTSSSQSIIFFTSQSHFFT